MTKGRILNNYLTTCITIMKTSKPGARVTCNRSKGKIGQRIEDFPKAIADEQGLCLTKQQVVI